MSRYKTITAFAALTYALPLSAQSTGRTPADVRSPAAQKVIALFSGKPADLAANWVRRGSNKPAAWKVQDGVMVAGGGDIVTKQKFKDFQLHLEWKPPVLPPNVRGQARGNSGVFLQGRYEIQVLDSYGVAEPGRGDAGAVYNQAAPLVNAYKPPTEWQTFDIFFRAPRVDAAGKMTEKARVTVLLNGFIIQNNQEIQGSTGGPQDENPREPGAIRLQDHGNPVQFRNILILPLPEKSGSRY